MTRKSTKSTKAATSPRRRYPAPDHHQPQTEPPHTPLAIEIDFDSVFAYNGRRYVVTSLQDDSHTATAFGLYASKRPAYLRLELCEEWP